MSSAVERQKMYDFWKSSSDISNDHRNARHMVKRPKRKLDHAVHDLSDTNITTYKGGLKVKAQKYIYNKNVRQLYQNFGRCILS